MKILSIDIETSPNLAHVWGLWQQDVGLTQLIQSTEMICFAAKWVGDKAVTFRSVFHDNKEVMVREAWRLLNEADAVLHYNGRRFDVPHLNREFLALGLTPPSPYRQIDLCEVAKRQFKFPSNTLAYVSGALAIGGKVPHEGHVMWVKCLAGDAGAWAKMRKYNIQDTRLNEALYERLRPWIPNHPSYGALNGEDVCPTCGSADLSREGHAYTQSGKFQRFVCKGCGRWSRSSRRVEGTKVVGVAS